jgi:hypothetical protein
LSDFDAQQVVNAVQSGTIPETWKVFRAPGKSHAASGIVMVALAILFSASLLVSLLFASPNATAPTPWQSILFQGVFALAFASVGFYNLRQVFAAGAQWVAVTPTGFVEYLGKREGISRRIAFEQCSSISLRTLRSYITTYGIRHISSVSIGLELNYKSHLNLKAPLPSIWDIGDRFASADTIAQTVIEAYARYLANHLLKYAEEA